MYLSLSIESDQVSNNTNYEDQVIEIARSNMNLVPDMEKLLRTVYRAGYNECLRNIKEKREPVAWRYALDASVEGPRWIYIDKDPHQWLQGPAMVNAAIEELHTSPQPSKPWVGLTDEELAEIDGVEMKYIGTGEYVIDGEYEFARAIETKLREKNT